MKAHPFLLILSLAFLVLSPPHHAQQAANPAPLPDYPSLYDQLLDMKPDPSRVAEVRRITLIRDAGRFDLHAGHLFQMTPVAGRTVGAVFVGNGTATVTPPTAIEREQLYRFYETRTLQKDFTVLFLLFGDTTMAELNRHLTFRPFPNTSENRTAEAHAEYALRYLSDRDGRWFDTGIARTLLEGDTNGTFHAHFSEEKDEPMAFRVDPFAIEEIRLMRRDDSRRFDHVFETVCQFHKQGDDRIYRDPADERKKPIKVVHYTIESTIEGNLDYSAACTVELTAMEPGHDWIPFRMFADMEVDSAFWQDGKAAHFFKEKDNPLLWVRADSTLPAYAIRALTLHYRGDLLARDDFSWIYIKDPTGWYPRYGNRETATFDLTFHTPEQFTFVSVGDLQSSETRDRTLTTRWLTPTPIRNASFNLGDYKAHEIEDARIPAVTVYMSKSGHQAISHALGRRGVLSGKNMEKQVGADIANSLAFFQHVFGPSGTPRFAATETPYGHGLAFPGLIHLSWSTFQRTHERGYDEVFRAHEVAHQWWGIGVDFKTYHDQWISEGFSDYAGLWYLQMVSEGNEKFFDLLEEYRKEILNNRKYLFGSGQEAGPIWLGYRTNSSSTEGDYGLIIYKKGAWVLHMLRNMVLDLKTMNEDVFTNMMRDVYKTYTGKKISTADFQAVVEKHFGMKMGWFFDQWVYGTDVPTYRVAHAVQKAEGDRYKVTCRIRQEEVPPDFRMYMNLKVDFGKDRYAYLRVLIDEAEEVVQLPLLPMKPKKIEFNALASVLCELKEERWSD